MYTTKDALEILSKNPSLDERRITDIYFIVYTAFKRKTVKGEENEDMYKSKYEFKGWVFSLQEFNTLDGNISTRVAQAKNGFPNQFLASSFEEGKDVIEKLGIRYHLKMPQYWTM